MDNCHRKLKPQGKLLLHIQLIDNIWKTEEDWKKDTSINGKLKYNYGLHCFGRTEDEYIEIVSKHGFGNVKIEQFEGFAAQYDEELKSQRPFDCLQKSLNHFMVEFHLI